MRLGADLIQHSTFTIQHSELVPGAGFEPATPRSTIWCSNQLSYPGTSARMIHAEGGGENAAADRCILRYATRINGLTALAVTKLDVLSGLDRIKVCTRYRGLDDAEFDTFPYHQSVLHHAAGEYEELPGWRDDLGECRAEADLPAAARDYLAYVAEAIRVPVVLVGVGPGREQVIWTGADSMQRAAA